MLTQIIIGILGFSSLALLAQKLLPKKKVALAKAKRTSRD
jgi:hypothetical protein